VKLPLPSYFLFRRVGPRFIALTHPPTLSQPSTFLINPHTFARQVFYLVGGNKARTQYRILQIERTKQDELPVVEDPVVYSYDECMTRVRQLELLHQHEGGVQRRQRYRALLGFVRFFSTFYLVLVPEAAAVGVIAGHQIYTLTEAPQLIAINATLSNDRYVRAG
jgi:hypothetical protein